MTAFHGRYRAIPHFLIWAALPNIASWFLLKAGVGMEWIILTPALALPVFTLVIMVQEVVEVHSQVQTWGKGILDFSSKVLGFVVGLWTWYWWWM